MISDVSASFPEPPLPLGPSGLVALEADLLGAVASAKPRASTLDVIERVLRMRGGGGSVDSVHTALTTLALPVRLQFPLFSFHGNGGTWDDGADSPENTRVALTGIGRAAADAVSGTGQPVPWDLLNGSIHRGGARIAFTAKAVAYAMDRALTNEPIDTDHLDLCVASGAVARGDLQSYVDGQPADFDFDSTIVATKSGAVITGVPPRISPRTIADHVGRTYLLPTTDMTVGSDVRVDVWVPPEGGGSRLAPLLDRTDEALRERIVLWLGQPLPLFLAEWIRRHGPDRARAGLTLLATTSSE